MWRRKNRPSQSATETEAKSYRKDRFVRSASETETGLGWVDLLTDWGRPLVAAIVLVMCAPGEHFLARLAGWNQWLAWGMPAVLTAYAGIAAVVAAKRPRKTEGKATAVAGAVVSVLLAMAAQPVAHLLMLTGPWDTRHTVTLVVSCIPSLVLGHLLHLAASQKSKRAPSQRRTAVVPSQNGVAAAASPGRDAVSASVSRRAVSETPRADKRLSTETPLAQIEGVPETPSVAETLSHFPAGTGSVSEDDLLTTAEAAQAASQARGETVKPSTVRTWKSRGHLTPAVDEDMTLYRRGDVLAYATRNTVPVTGD